MNYMTTITKGPEHLQGRSFVIEDVRNEADAIEETFKRANANAEIDGEEYLRVEVTELPLGRKKYAHLTNS